MLCWLLRVPAHQNRLYLQWNSDIIRFSSIWLDERPISSTYEERFIMLCYKICYGTTEQSLQTCLCSYVVANVVIIIKNSGESFMVHRSCLIYPWIAKLNPLIQSQTWSALLICFPTPGQSIYLKNQSTGNFLFKARITNATLASTFQVERKTINIHCLSNVEN